MGQNEIHKCQCADCRSGTSAQTQVNHHLINLLMSRLDEQQRRWYAAVEAKRLGHGGTKLVSKITGLHVNTIRRGRKELEKDLEDRPRDRQRLAGAGRKRVEDQTPAVETALEEIVADDVAGVPTSDQQWVRNSLRRIAQELAKRKFRVGKTTVRRLLRKLKVGLMGNRKSLTGDRHPDRDRQFRFIKRVKRLFLQAGLPVISVDTKKKELVGQFLNKGRTWRREPEQVNVHDFRQDALGRAVPYGLYDLTHNQGTVYIGTSADTAEFAVYAIAQWWQDPERPRFQREDALLILCDAGGSNSYRYWLWKHELQQQLADRFGITVMVCHYPTGASKYNPIEYRLFSQISLNWAGKPLRSFQTMLNLIRNTTTQTGLTVRAFLVERIFETKRKVTAAQRKAIRLQRRAVCPQWNYSILPSALTEASLLKC